MTYTEDREQFERDLMRPPHLARMLDHAGKFVGRLSKADKDALLTIAMENFWVNRDGIHNANDIPRVWVLSLSIAARSRPRWCEWYNVGSWQWTRGTRLGRD